MKKFWEILKKYKWIILIFLILACSYYYFFIYKKNSTNQKETKKVFEVKKGDINISVSGTGQVYAGNQVDLKPQVAGDGLDVISVKVENNQEVKKGDIIAILDSSDARQKIQEAELSLKSAEIKMKQTKKLNDSKKDDDVWARNLQKNSLKQSQISLNKAYKDLQDYSIKAPFDGVVTGLSVSAGDSISRSEILASVITKDFKAKISLNEIDAVKVKVGDKTKLTFDSLNGLSVEGEVSKVATIGSVNQGVVTYEVEISFNSPSEFLKPGMSVSVEISIENVKNVLTLPMEAIQKFNEKSFVMIENTDGSLIRKNVETGLTNDVLVEIKNSDLKDGDKVVVNQKVSNNTENSNSGSLFPTMNNRNNRNAR